jgi:hypothetical protein
MMPSQDISFSSQEPVVAAGVAGAVALPAEHVRQRVDRVGAVVAGHGRDEEAPDEHLPAVGAQRGREVFEQHAEAEHADRQRHRHEDVEPVEPAEFRELQEVPHPPQVRGETAGGQEPAHVGFQEAVLDRRVRVLGPIGVRVVVPVVGCPPDGSALHGGGAEQAEDELADAGRLEGAVGEVTVVEAGDREHAHEVADHGHGDRDRTPADHEHQQAGRVHADERQDAGPLDPVFADLGRGVGGNGAGVEPAQEGAAEPEQGVGRRVDGRGRHQ